MEESTRTVGILVPQDRGRKYAFAHRTFGEYLASCALVGDQLAALRSLLGAAADDTVPTLPTRLLEGPDTRLTLGGTVFEFRHRGGGHTPGDMMVWLPQARVVFAGDIVYVDRLLAVLPVSSTSALLAPIDPLIWPFVTVIVLGPPAPTT